MSSQIYSCIKVVCSDWPEHSICKMGGRRVMLSVVHQTRPINRNNAHQEPRPVAMGLSPVSNHIQQVQLGVSR